jgi:membrane protease YdiL (CAAX protease family)
MPLEHVEIQFTFWKTNWNWSGKIYAIFGSVAFLILYRKFTLKDYFLTIKQNGNFLKIGFLTIVSILAIQVILSLISNINKNWDLETLLFQFTLPGIDEEIAYRGIMLGLLTKSLSNDIKFFGKTTINVSILTTAMLFGFAHSFHLDKSLDVIFKITPFIQSTIYGIIWGWLTVKSGSILSALISHNLGNGLSNMVLMK